MTLENIIQFILSSLIVALISSLISSLIAVWVGEKLRKRNFQKETRLTILYNLIFYRHKIESDEFLSSLNSLKLFYNDNELNSMLFELRKSFQIRDNITNENNKKEKEKECDILITKIIKRVCELEKFNNIAIEDIDNLFKKK